MTTTYPGGNFSDGQATPELSSKGSLDKFWYFPFSQKDLENLKAEVQRRQQLQELGKIEETTEDSRLELEDKIPID